MSERRREDLLFAGTIIIAIVLILFSSISSKREGYRQGQIDAINGQIKYHLVEQPDQTVAWERIDQ